MKEIFDMIPVWLEVKVNIELLGRYNTLNWLDKGEKIFLTDIFIEAYDYPLYEINFLAKRLGYPNRLLWERDRMMAMTLQERMVEGSFYVENREEFDYFFKVLEGGI